MEVTSEIATIYRREHVDLKKDLMFRVQALLGEPCEILSYAVDTEYGVDRELLKLKFNHLELQITLVKR